MPRKKNASRRFREEVLNVNLATCLSSRGVQADPETIIQRSQREMPDVIFWYCGLRCAIEGKVADRLGDSVADSHDWIKLQNVALPERLGFSMAQSLG